MELTLSGGFAFLYTVYSGLHGQLSGVLEEECDWAALAAPKPALFQHGRQDTSFCPGADVKHLDLPWNTGILPPTEYDAMFAEFRGVWKTRKRGAVQPG